MVTAEVAVALPALVLVLAVGLAVIAIVTAQLRCTDAAAVGARLAARGEPAAAVRSATLAVAPAGAGVQVRPGRDGVVLVTVTATMRVPAVGRFLPARTVRATVAEPVEPGAMP